MKIRSLFAAVAVILSSSAAIAAPVSFDLDVYATVPSSTALDVWDPTGWSASKSEMVYERGPKTFKPVKGPLEIKGGVGSVEAYLTFAPQLLDGSKSIDMNVTVGTVALAVGAGAAVEVVSASDAVAGVRRELSITAAAAPTGGYLVGNYEGPVHMVFDTKAP